MSTWSFYGRGEILQDLKTMVHNKSWFFCRIQGRRRIGKTSLLVQLIESDPNLRQRMIYMQVPDSDQVDVAATFRRALEASGIDSATAIAASVSDFASMTQAIKDLCSLGLIIVLDEFQYFTRASLSSFTSFLQAAVDQLRGTFKGGIFVLGSIQSEMSALLSDNGAPLYGRLTNSYELVHWDFEELLQVFRVHGIKSPSQWLTLWSYFEGVPKFYRDAYDQGIFSAAESEMPDLLLRKMFLREGSPLAEEATTSFLRDLRGRMLSVLNYLSDHPGCVHGDLVAALNKDDDATALGTTIRRLVENYRMVDRQLPVFSEGKSRNGRFYITDNFLQAWLSVVKPARDNARIRPLDDVLSLATPRRFTYEGYAFEKLIRQLHTECSRKGKGGFPITDINMGYWNRPRDLKKSIEIDVVAINSDKKIARFGSCKRSSNSHDLAVFEDHISAFLRTKEGKKLSEWKIERVLFSPLFSEKDRSYFESKGYKCLDLMDYASLFS